MAASKLPAFESLLKSRDVEDPVNLWLHRPLAYGFVALVHRSPITPNQITMLAMLVGLVAAGCFIAGTPAAMLWGGALLWSSSILDGADGILARAQRRFSALGRALDGSADAVVGLSTVSAAGYHLWTVHHDPVQAILVAVALMTTVVQIYMYDFYKESYLQLTNPQWNGRPEQIADARQRLGGVKADQAGFAATAASLVYVDLMLAQDACVTRFDPAGRREGLQFKAGDTTAAVYRRFNRAPMQVWAIISLAPHSYLMSIFAMLDRLELYIWVRLIGANALFLIVLLWQRWASRRTREELALHGLAPVPAA